MKKKTEFLRELRKTGFCEFKVTVCRAVHLRECALGELLLTVIISNNNDFLAVLLELKKGIQHKPSTTNVYSHTF